MHPQDWHKPEWQGQMHAVQKLHIKSPAVHNSTIERSNGLYLVRVLMCMAVLPFCMLVVMVVMCMVMATLAARFLAVMLMIMCMLAGIMRMVMIMLVRMRVNVGLCHSRHSAAVLPLDVEAGHYATGARAKHAMDVHSPLLAGHHLHHAIITASASLPLLQIEVCFVCWSHLQNQHRST